MSQLTWLPETSTGWSLLPSDALWFVQNLCSFDILCSRSGPLRGNAMYSGTLERKWVPGIFLGVKSGRRVELTTLPPSVSRISENVGASTSRNPKGLHGLYRDNFTFYLYSGTQVQTFLRNLLPPSSGSKRLLMRLRLSILDGLANLYHSVPLTNNHRMFPNYIFLTFMEELRACEIWGFHGGKYEDCRLLRCAAV
jgi:hypothetical protein